MTDFQRSLLGLVCINLALLMLPTGKWYQALMALHLAVVGLGITLHMTWTGLRDIWKLIKGKGND